MSSVKKLFEKLYERYNENYLKMKEFQKEQVLINLKIFLLQKYQVMR